MKQEDDNYWKVMYLCVCVCVSVCVCVFVSKIWTKVAKMDPKVGDSSFFFFNLQFFFIIIK